MMWTDRNGVFGPSTAEPEHASRRQRVRLFLARLICLGSPAAELRH